MKESKGNKNLDIKRSVVFSNSLKISASLQRLCGLLLFSFLVSCSQFEKPKTEPFYAETAPPQKKEFRWSNGKMPKSFDPAKAAAPPETDIVRAVYEGLTDTDSKTLEPIPALATEWKASEDYKTWTFNLRKDAKWSNGEAVTAKDFVRSWKRLAVLGEKVAHRELLRNIVGLQTAATENISLNEEENSVVFSRHGINPNDPQINIPTNTNSGSVSPQTTPQIPVGNKQIEQKTPSGKQAEVPFGVEAIDNFTLKVSLLKPDKDFPAIVAHPIFFPIYGDGKNFETDKLNADIVTNGAFRIFSIGQDGITLDRADFYWNKDSIELERVRFVPTENAEKALEAYRAGEVDAVTNADFEPLALKLLTPYEDFRRTSYNAINFYEFNRNKAPFDDRRVREALAISIERERLTEDELDGASKPALSFLPTEKEGEKQLTQDAQKAKNLLAESGFPEGENFPIVKLLINRNNVQQRIAKSVAKMWKENLNVETEIVVKDSAEITTAWETDEFALLRRGVVLPTANETASMLAIFSPKKEKENHEVETNSLPNANNAPANQNLIPKSSVSPPEQSKKTGESASAVIGENSILAMSVAEDEMILTEEEAISELHAIPLYFPTSYSLVKPYIQGFDINILDAPSLKNVRIDITWQPAKTKGES